MSGTPIQMGIVYPLSKSGGWRNRGFGIGWNCRYSRRIVPVVKRLIKAVNIEIDTLFALSPNRFWCHSNVK